MGEQTALMPIPTDSERMLLARLEEARREIAISRSLLASAWEREKAQDTTIRELRHELLEARDVIGRMASVEPPGPIADWLRDFGGDRRRIGR